jgi:hypothetical protein
MRLFARSIRTIIVVGAALSILWLDALPESVACGSPGERRPTEQLKGFAVSNARITDFVRELTKVTGLRICVEEARILPAHDKSEASAGEQEGGAEIGLNIDIADGTVYDALNRLVDLDARYAWKRDPETDTINVYPVENAPLGWMTGPLRIRNRALDDVLAMNDLLGLRENNVIFSPRGNLTWLKTHVTLESRPLTARGALNRLCAQLDFRARWEVYEITSPNGELRHMLMIKGAYREGTGPLPTKVDDDEGVSPAPP